MSAKAQSAALQQPNLPTPNDKSAADERRSGMRTIMRVAPYLWPKDRMDIRLRVVGSLLFLILSKVLSIYSPSFTVRRLMPCLMGACRSLRWGLLG